MNLLNSPLIAETHLAEVSLQYREESVSTGAPIWAYLAIPVVAVLVALAIYKWFNRSPAIVNTPLGMLHELCKVHRIGARGRLLLERIAEVCKLESPAVVFGSREGFDQYVEQAGKSIRYTSKQKSTLGMLRRKLFA